MPTSTSDKPNGQALSAPEPSRAGGAAGIELVTKVDAILTILEQRGETTAADISGLTGEPLSSVYRLLQSLTAIGWVERGWRRGSYRLGLLLLSIGSTLADQVDVREAALPALRQLLKETGASSFLCIRRDSRAVCIERLEGVAVRSLAMQLGSSLPLYAGAAPRSILAFLPNEEVDVVLATAVVPDDPAPPARAQIEADIDRTRRYGHAVSDGDVTPGIAALGAPVFDHRGDVAAAISISGMRNQILDQVRQRNVDLIVRAATRVSEALGYDGRGGRSVGAQVQLPVPATGGGHADER